MGEKVVGEAEIAAAARWVANWLWWRVGGPGDDLRARIRARLEAPEAGDVEFPVCVKFPVRPGSIAYADGTYGNVEAELLVYLSPGRVTVAEPMRGGGYTCHVAYYDESIPAATGYWTS